MYSIAWGYQKGQENGHKMWPIRGLAVASTQIEEKDEVAGSHCVTLHYGVRCKRGECKLKPFPDIFFPFPGLFSRRLL